VFSLNLYQVPQGDTHSKVLGIRAGDIFGAILPSARQSFFSLAITVSGSCCFQIKFRIKFRELQKADQPMRDSISDLVSYVHHTGLIPLSPFRSLFWLLLVRSPTSVHLLLTRGPSVCPSPPLLSCVLLMPPCLSPSGFIEVTVSCHRIPESKAETLRLPLSGLAQYLAHESSILLVLFD
jgi:hypothetical protein